MPVEPRKPRRLLALEQQVRRHPRPARRELRELEPPKPRNIGRPLAASIEQCNTVLRLHEQGCSLRGIADETNLSVRTIRTIVEKQDGADRASVRHRKRPPLP
jgi:DNA-binding NarL/FixJ family response regulator